MSFQAVTWAIEVRVGDPILKNLLIAICHHADRENWSCWPSQDTLAYETEVSKRTIQRKLEELQERGFIRIEKRRNPDGTQANSMLTVSGGQSVTLCPPVDKNGLTGGQKRGVPVDSTCPPIMKQSEQSEQSFMADEYFSSEISPPPVPEKPKRKVRSTIDPHLAMSDKNKKYATDRGISATYAATVFENFKNYHLAKGSLMLDWDAAWRTWVGYEMKRFNGGQRPPPNNQPPRAGMVYGDDYM